MRTYELPHSPSQALELLRDVAALPVVGADEATTRRFRRPFVVMAPDGFTLYQPWRSTRDLGLDAALGGDMSAGPAVRGRLVPTVRGSRLELSVRRLAPTPAQRSRFAAAVAAWVLFVVAPVAIAGLHPVALCFSAVSLLGGLAGLLVSDRERRATEVRDLLGKVESVFAPLELAAHDPVPHRLAALPESE